MKQKTIQILMSMLVLAAGILPAGPALADATGAGGKGTPSSAERLNQAIASTLHPLAGRGAAPLVNPAPECPVGLNCRFVPAAYAQDDPADPSNYGNYDYANRPNDVSIKYIVIHDTEGTYNSAIQEFQDPTTYVSAHYVVRSADGAVTQMVPTKDVAWHAGNWYTNQHSIGIENEGFAAQGSKYYTDAEYVSTARLVRYLAQKYHIPMDRQHIIGHEDVQAPTAGLVAGMHTDPGPYWDWSKFMALVGAPVLPSVFGSQMITIAPNFQANRPDVTDCSSGTCVTEPKQGANFVYLRSAPSDSAPLLTDPALNPSGTTRLDDTSDKAVYGQQFALAGRQGAWTGIWYGGKIGWFKDGGASLPATGQLITPKAGLTSIPVYGRAYPEASAYAGTAVPVQAVTPLQYTIPAGQRYTTTGLVPTDYYYAWTIDSRLPDDHTVVIGHDRYYQISYNHRIAYVRADDVNVTSAH